jgi:phage-related protein
MHKDDATGAYRVIYVAKFAEAIYVLHVFAKKTQKTAPRDIALARRRYAELPRERS